MNFGNEALFGAVVVLITVLLLAIWNSSSRKKRREDIPLAQRNILTKNEYPFWLVLRKKAAAYSLLICPKVRMEDFLYVTSSDAKKRMSWRGRIKSRHIDFILCDKNMKMVCGVELDDKSHKYNASTIEGDKLKNDVFEHIGVPLFRIIVDNGEYEEQLEDMFSSLKRSKLIK